MPPWHLDCHIRKTVKAAVSCSGCRVHLTRSRAPKTCSVCLGTADMDVEIERALYHRLPPLSASEQALWTLDARINQRGFHIDRTLAEAARQLARKEQAHINATIAFLTDGTITTANQVEKILSVRAGARPHDEDFKQALGQRRARA